MQSGLIPLGVGAVREERRSRGKVTVGFHVAIQLNFIKTFNSNAICITVTMGMLVNFLFFKWTVLV